MRSVAIVGMSLAGLRSAEALRRAGFDGRISAIGAETHLPYDRPPRSKELLAGRWGPDELLLRKQGVDDLDLDWRLGRGAASLDLATREVGLEDGGRVDFDGLVIATGSEPRVLPGLDALDGVFALRTIDDALAIRSRLDGSPRVTVIGAGFIGAEVAATCRGRGLEVTVLEALPQPMVRGLGSEIGAVCAALHRDNGVDLRLGVSVDAVEGDGRVERVRLADGSVVDTDLLIVGIGVRPATDWLEGSGLTIADGVVCDETLLAAPGVVAAGDVARWPNPLFDGESMRLEHWTNAAEQSVAAAERLLAAEGEAVPFAPVPFVWSDQYDVKIQCVGRFNADDDLYVAHGTLAERRFVALFGRAGRLVGALGFGRPRPVMQYRRMISERGTYADALQHAASG